MLLSNVFQQSTALIVCFLGAAAADYSHQPILHAPRSAKLETRSTPDQGLTVVDGRNYRVSHEAVVLESDAESLQLVFDEQTQIAEGDLLRSKYAPRRENLLFRDSSSIVVGSTDSDSQVHDAKSLGAAGFESDVVLGNKVMVQLLTPADQYSRRHLTAWRRETSQAAVASVKRALPMQEQAEHSDEFEYQGKTEAFNNKWLDNHRNGWDGPGNTLFESERSVVNDGNLVIQGRRASDDRVSCGYVTSKTPINYPVYTEVSMKASGLKLSSNFWLLSGDDVNEIDVIEVYGNEERKGKEMSTNFHIFQRTPFKDLANHARGYFVNGVLASNEGTPTDADAADQPYLRDGFHRYGVYWKNATEFEFYLDGKLVRTLNKNNDLEDPRGKFFDQPMYIIMNTESHTSRFEKGIVPTNAELSNNTINNVYYQWIRTFK